MQTNTHARPVFTYTIGENENNSRGHYQSVFQLIVTPSRKVEKIYNLYLKFFAFEQQFVVLQYFES
jgi:hypothetical protein